MFWRLPPPYPHWAAGYPPEVPEGTETKGGQGSRPGAAARTRAQTGVPASASTASSERWLLRAPETFPVPRNTHPREVWFVQPQTQRASLQQAFPWLVFVS